MHFLATIGLLAALVTRAQASTAFVLPGPNTQGDNVNYAQNSQYKVGQTIDVKWDSNYSTFDLYLLLEYPSELSVQLAGNTSAKTFGWTVGLDNYTTNIPAGEDYVFWFTLDSYDAEGTDVANSDSLFFNVSAPTKSGLSNGAVTGIAAGATAGGLILIFGFIIWKLLRELKTLRAWKAQVEYDAQHANMGSPSMYYYSGDTGQSQMYQPVPVPKTEVSTPHELVSPQPQSPREMYVAPS